MSQSDDIIAALEADPQEAECSRLRTELAEAEERMNVVLHAGPSTGLAVSVFDRAKRAESALAELRGALEFLSHPNTNDHDVSVEEWPTRSDGTGYYRLQVGYVDETQSAKGATASEAYINLARLLGWTPEAKP